MSWLQRIIDRDPSDAITVPENPGVRTEIDSGSESLLYLEKSIPAGSDTDAVPPPDTNTHTGKSILIVEDEVIVANDIKETLKSLGYYVTDIAKSGEEALEKVKELRPDIVLMDIHLATSLDGIQVAGKIHLLYDIPVIYLTAYADQSLLDRAKVTEPFGYVIKPCGERELQSTIEIAFYKNKQKHDLQVLKAYGELEHRVAERTEELERINHAMAESEKRYRSLFEGIPIGLYRTTRSGRFLDVNPALVHLLGYPNHEMLMNVSVSDLYMNPGDRNLWLDLIERKGIVHNFKVQVRKYNGTIIWVRDTGNAIYDDKGQLLYYNGNVEDITERLRVEEELRTYQIELETQAEELRRTQFALEASLNRYLDLYEYAPVGYLTLTEEALITDVNRAGTALFWVDRNYLITLGIIRFIAPESHNEWDQFFGRIRSSKEKQCCNLVFRLEDGSSFPARLEGVRLPNASDNARILLAISDITTIRQYEEAIRASEKDYRNLVNLAQEGIWAIDADGKTTFVNPKMAEMLGYTVEEMLGAHLFSFMDDAGKTIAADKIERRIQGITEEHEFEFITKEGNLIYASLATAPIKDEKGVYKGALAVVSDITYRKQAEEALRTSEQRYRDVIEDQTEFICRFLPDGKLTFINEAYCNYFRLNREEIIGKQHSVVLPREDLQLMKNHLTSLTQENPVAWITHRIVLPSSEVRWQHWSDRAIFDNEGNAIEYQSVGRDITSQKEIEIQLKKYKETLEQQVRDRTADLSKTNLKLRKEIEDRKKIQKKLTLSSNEKDLLLREVHHRVKNNLQLIIGLIDMTKTRAHEPIVISTLTDIMAKVQTMGSIHTRLYESKRFDKIDMRKQVHDLVEMISGFYDHDYIDITINIDCAEIYLPVDQAIPCALALNEIISNIHKHAFKGRRSGHVEISSSMKEEMLRFVVKDNGVGLPSGFDIEKSNRSGLRLMRTLVEQQLLGNVQITSKNGTEVGIEFPITRGESDDSTSNDS